MNRFFSIFVASIVLTTWVKYEAQGLSCFCGAAPCEAPKCCESGSYTLDACGCCPVCAKGTNQDCGGPFRTQGRCDVGLSCVKQCSCKSEKGLDCIFPFKFKETTYNACTDFESVNNKTWCATEVDDEGVVVGGKWDDCDFSCPAEDYPCNEGYFFNLVGRCMNITEAESIQDRSGSSVNIEDGLAEADLAPICGAVEDDNFCKCSEEPLSPLTGSKTGNSCEPLRGNFIAEANGWCFLQRVEDPSNPTKNCYEDVQWSETHGRFWSNLACKPAIVIEGRTSSDDDLSYADEAQIVFEE